MDQSDLLLIAFSLSSVTYFLSPLMMNLHKKELVAWSIILRNDAIISMIAIGTVSSVRLLLQFVQNLVIQSSPDLANTDQAFTSIMGQLVGIDATLVTLVGVTSAIPTIQGLGILLDHVLGPAISIINTAIIMWTLLRVASDIIPTLFLTIFSVGLVLYSIPFRLGRSTGASTIAFAMVFYIGLPLAGPAAIWLENYVINPSDLDDLKGTAQSVNSSILSHIFSDFSLTNLASLLARIVAGVVIALIAFPVMFLALLGSFVTSLARLIGGSSSSILLGAVERWM